MNSLRFAATFALCMTLSSAVYAYDASVFEGQPRETKLEDLYPRFDQASKTYYSEEYSFTIELQDEATATVQFGFSNVLGDAGSAFVNVAWNTKQHKAERVRITLPKGEWSFTKSPLAFNFGPVTFSADKKEFTLKATGNKTDLEISFVPLVPGFVPGSGQVKLGSEGFVEMLLWPRLSMRAKVTDRKTNMSQTVDGWAVLTHSTTTLPPQFQPTKWVQFRSDDPKKLFLLQVVQLPEAFGGTFGGWFVAYDNLKLVASSTKLKVTPVTEGTYGGKSIPVAFLLEDAEQKLAVGLRALKFRRISDQLKKLPKLQRAIVAKYIHPMSYQFGGEAELQITVGQHFAFLPAVKASKYTGFLKVDTIR